MKYMTDVYLNQQCVGTAEITKKGLYYHILCRCELPDKQVYRLMGKCGERTVDLGICVPFDDGFGVDKMVSIKSVGADKITLFLSDNRGDCDSKFFPLQKGKAFECMEFLKEARFERRGELAGLVIKKN